METTNIVDFARRDGITEVRSAGIDRSNCRAQRASSGAAISNWYWPCERAHFQGALKRPHARDLSLSPGAALCAQNQDAGSSLALALSQRCFQW